MKETIYTIPLTDAFHANDECPFCFLERKLEEDAIAFTLGASYMEDDIRAITDKEGFCPTHYKKLYDYGNRLGLALILHTHYQKLSKELDQALENTSLPKASLLQKLTKSTASNKETTVSPVSKLIEEKTNSCYICNRVNTNITRYMETFFHLIHTSSSFYDTFSTSKGLCLSHFQKLIDLAPLHLKEEEKKRFFDTTKKLVEENMKRIEEDLSWFIDKYDYNNNDAPWKNSKDAIPRGIQKLASIYVQDPPFKKPS